MEGFVALFIAFGICLFLAGLYLYKGNDDKAFLWKDHKKKHSLNELKQIGKWTMIISIIPIVIAIIVLLVG